MEKLEDPPAEPFAGRPGGRGHRPLPLKATQPEPPERASAGAMLLTASGGRAGRAAAFRDSLLGGFHGDTGAYESCG